MNARNDRDAGFMWWLLDKFCFVFHTLLIVFNMVGWAWRRTRWLHLVTFSLTAVSWFVLGAWYGWGYCVFADWHFAIRRRAGWEDPDSSYVQLLVREALGWTWSRATADWVAGVVFALITLATITVWAFRPRRTRGNGVPPGAPTAP